MPTEGTWKAQARAVDTAGQSALDTADRDWIVSEDGAAPTVSISAPAVMVPPTAAQPLVVAPGSPLTFSGPPTTTAAPQQRRDPAAQHHDPREPRRRRQWSTDVLQDWYRISPINLSQSSYNWSYTTPFNLKPGSYSFEVRATDDLGLTTASANQGKLTVNAQVPGDAPAGRQLIT